MKEKSYELTEITEAAKKVAKILSNFNSLQYDDIFNLARTMVPGLKQENHLFDPKLSLSVKPEDYESDNF